MTELLGTYTDFSRIRKDMAKALLDDTVAEYFTAPFGHKLAVYFADGKFSFHVGDSVGREINPAERALAVIECPGIGNIETPFWTEGWTTPDPNDPGVYIIDDTGEKIELEECIRRCCHDGDIVDEKYEIIQELYEWLVYDLET